MIPIYCCFFNWLSIEIYRFLKYYEIWSFKTDRQSCSTLPWESNFYKLFSQAVWVKKGQNVLLKKAMIFKGDNFWGVCYSVHSRVFCRLEMSVLMGLTSCSKALTIVATGTNLKQELAFLKIYVRMAHLHFKWY